MKSLLIYLFQVVAISGILYCYYHFVLRNKKFHRYNRFYLLAATIVSIFIPFLNIPLYFTQTEAESSFVLQSLRIISATGSDDAIVTVSHTSNISHWFTWKNISFLFYFFISFLVLLRIIISLLKIRRIINTNLVERIEKIYFVNTAEPGTPFSFFRWLFWNKKIELKSPKGEQIFRHEFFHIEQKHSRDIIYMELITVIFWINPFFHLIKKELKAIHEFLADQFAVSENSKWQYAELLLMQALNTNQRLVNPFFNNQIKRRIAMITTSKKPSYQYLRKLMVFPITAIVLGMFAFSYKQKNETNKSDKSFSSEVAVVDTIKPVKINGAKLSEEKPGLADNKIFDKVEIEPSFPGGDLKWRQYLERNLDASVPTKKKAPYGTYTTAIQFVVDKEGNISDAKALTAHGYGIEEEAIRAIKNGPKWDPAIQNGRQVTAYKSQPITFVVMKNQNAISPKTIQNEDVPRMIFDKVEIPPSFPGGDTAWQRYLQRNANALVPVDSGAPPGIYKVVVQFIVKTDGSVSDFKSITSHGYGMENEALRIIKNVPKWIPARQNGREVNAYVQQPVTFQISEDPDKDEKATKNQ
jgi:TonB family protein